MISIALFQTKFLRFCALLLVIMLTLTSVQAAFFEDEEARKAILDLRQRVETLRLETDQWKTVATSENAGLGKSLLDLQRQIELLRVEISTLRGSNEQLRKDLSDIQRMQKDYSQALNDRISKLEPQKEAIDGAEFTVEPSEKREFESALLVFRKGDFSAAQSLFAGFISRHPASGYSPSALFWLGNAQYATRDYKEAIINFRALIAKEPNHLRAPESVLSIANCQLELKDSKGARKTLTDLVKTYPQSEAAIAAKERLISLK
jgi:tol-pal system protein YbgF